MSKVDYKEEQKKSILNNPKAVEFLKQFNLKRVVAGRGHDCGGLVCDLYIRSVMYADFNDDGWGGEPNITWSSEEKRIKLTKMLKEVDFAQIMFDNGWAFLDTVEKVDLQTQVEHLIDTLAVLKDLEKLQKKCKGRFIYGTSHWNREVYWTGVKDLKQLSVRQLQKTYDGIKAKLTDGQKFVNTDEQLIGLGIKL